MTNSLIYINPEESTNALSKIFGDANIKGPTDIVEDEKQIKFDVSYFSLPLSVTFDKITGVISSNPDHKDYVCYVSSQNTNRAPKRAVPDLKEDDKIYVTPEELIHGLASVFGDWHVHKPSQIVDTDDKVTFKTYWNQQPLDVILLKKLGIIETKPFNREFVSYSVNYNISRKPKPSS
ncbi:hypothetical protein DICPUDRAFT_75164 [Dictyostelium purpureum]|uniref:Uncharacterized protein n=1 Tax=Dictyostelium purpureum TaxID=5786 RepID=F0Z9V3_DICPU|nr:uncharacterized protein DICPUDRAFT_75164 [Dictyostelium purpureum]EGC39304.1 hypothetical protein DICPUDRAFT_75164 [Dictyostelium purpureum]|eukprot:XP_003284208.1 hypothetical protein DICPUDRAFT_75164 [Dictyostelium purpureum]